MCYMSVPFNFLLIFEIILKHIEYMNAIHFLNVCSFLYFITCTSFKMMPFLTHIPTPHFLGFPPFPSSSQPSVLLGEDPPPYSPLTSPESGSAPMISCRVCQSLISVEGKIHQHVVKCGVCNEATVSTARMPAKYINNKVNICTTTLT